MNMRTLTNALNYIAGIDPPTLAAAGAANRIAGTSGIALVGALNRIAGTNGIDLAGVLNRIAGTSGLPADAAAAAWADRVATGGRWVYEEASQTYDSDRTYNGWTSV